MLTMTRCFKRQVRGISYFWARPRCNAIIIYIWIVVRDKRIVLDWVEEKNKINRPQSIFCFIKYDTFVRGEFQEDRNRTFSDGRFSERVLTPLPFPFPLGTPLVAKSIDPFCRTCASYVAPPLPRRYRQNAKRPIWRRKRKRWRPKTPG